VRPTLIATVAAVHTAAAQEMCIATGDRECRGPGSHPHPRFSCSCGMWYATERGRRAHLMREAAWLTVEEARAGMTLTKYCKAPEAGAEPT
jgi:hypothetical protein